MAPKQGTAQAVAPFQEMSLQPVAVNDSSMYESRVQQALYSNRVEAETQQAGQFSGLSTVTTRGDLNDQQGSGAGFYGRYSSPNASISKRSLVWLQKQALAFCCV